tara:strand:- start:84 stop:1283 length:1200 start_codon:yes stop_codon:yes gene_type:complete
MGKGGGQPTTTKQEITQTNLPEYVRPYFERLLQRTESESKRDYEPYGGQRISDPSTDLLSSEQMVRDITGRGLPGLDKAFSSLDTGSGLIGQGVGKYGLGERLVGEGSEVARGTLDDLGRATARTEQSFGFDPYQFSDARQFTGAERDRYMSPYLEGVLDVQKRKAREDYMKSMPQQAATAIGAGAFGGSREGVQRAEAQSDYLDRVGDIEATGRQQAFDRASQLFEADRRAEMGLDQTRAGERREAERLGLGAAQQLAGMGQTRLGVGQALGGFGGQLAGFGQGLAGLGGQFGQLGGQYANLATKARAGDVEAARMLEQIGKAQMGRDQASLDMGYQDFLRQQAYPQEKLGLLSSVLRGIPVQPNTMTKQMTPYDPFGRAIGLGLTALGGSGYFGGAR